MADEEKPTAVRFVAALREHQSDVELEKIQRYFKSGEGDYGEGDRFMGVRMGQVFMLAKDFVAMPPEEIERLLEDPIHEVRAGAAKVMGLQAAAKRTLEARRKELFELYLRRHDRINNGTSSTSAPATSSVAGCGTARATSSTSSRAPRSCGSGGPRS